MADLSTVLDAYVAEGELAGAVALLAQGERVDVATVGQVDLAGSAPMKRDTIFRIASITKPITAAAAMVLVDDGRLGLDDPASTWLPESPPRRSCAPRRAHWTTSSRPSRRPERDRRFLPPGRPAELLRKARPGGTQRLVCRST